MSLPMIQSNWVSEGRSKATTTYSGYTTQGDTHIKQFEVTFHEKQKGYAAFMQAMHDTFITSHKGNPADTMKMADGLQSKFFVIEPFLSDNVHEKTWEDLHQLIDLSDRFTHQRSKLKNAPTGAFVTDFTELRNKIRSQLRNELFSEMIEK